MSTTSESKRRPAGDVELFWAAYEAFRCTLQRSLSAGASDSFRRRLERDYGVLYQQIGATQGPDTLSEQTHAYRAKQAAWLFEEACRLSPCDAVYDYNSGDNDRFHCLVDVARIAHEEGYTCGYFLATLGGAILGARRAGVGQAMTEPYPDAPESLAAWREDVLRRCDVREVRPRSPRRGWHYALLAIPLLTLLLAGVLVAAHFFV